MIGVRVFEAYVSELRAWGSRTTTCRSTRSTMCSWSRGDSRKWFSTSRVSLGEWTFLSRSSPTASFDGRLAELRIYHSIWALTGRHLHRTPMLQRDPDLRAEGVVAQYQRALAVGDVDAITATFEPDGTPASPLAAEYVHRGHDALRQFSKLYFSVTGAASSWRIARARP